MRLGVTCPGYTRHNGRLTTLNMRLSTEAIYRASGIEKRRLGSCNACRTSKIRCTKTHPKCRRCQERNIECTYNTQSNPANALATPVQSPSMAIPQPASASVQPESASIDDPGLRARLLSAYFGKVHPLRCLAFIHKPSFMYARDRGTLKDQYDDALVDAMCALGARYCTTRSPSKFILTIACRCLYSDTSEEQFTPLLAISQALSERAHSKIMAKLSMPTVQQLMVRNTTTVSVSMCDD
jgi:hypothetical protein